MIHLPDFDLSEFDQRGLPGSGAKYMQVSFLEQLQRARTFYGKPMRITSGYRSPAYNKQVGGSPRSSHKGGWAVDIACPTPQERFAMLSALLQAGFRRVGVGKGFIHADNDPEKLKLLPTGQGLIWHYY